MYKYEDIRTIHLEVTEKCQAGCALCGRYEDDGSLNSYLTNAELSLKQSQQIFDRNFVRQLSSMYMCGNFGDPIVAKDTLEIFEYFRFNNTNMKLELHTNGGARNKEWWKDLAGLLYTDRCSVRFAIDGLEDTNHLYRENVNWNKLMESAESFISAGGNAYWVFIVFKHNEHQIEQARALAQKMGFKKFLLKKSSRFNGNKKTFKHLEIPSNPRYVNKKVDFANLVKEKYGSYDAFLDQTPVSCMVKRQNNLYVSARGLVLPCCFLGYGLFENIPTTKNRDQILGLIDSYDDINALSRPLKEIFESGFFDKIEQSWSKESVGCGKLATCASTCSTDHNFFNDMFSLNG